MDRLPGALQQQLEHRDLARPQTDDVAVGENPPAAPIEHDIGKGEGVFLTRGAAPYDRAYPRYQFVEVERFDEVVVGARIERAEAIGDLAACREHDNRH